MRKNKAKVKNTYKRYVLVAFLALITGIVVYSLIGNNKNSSNPSVTQVRKIKSYKGVEEKVSPGNKNYYFELSKDLDIVVEPVDSSVSDITTEKEVNVNVSLTHINLSKKDDKTLLLKNKQLKQNSEQPIYISVSLTNDPNIIIIHYSGEKGYEYYVDLTKKEVVFTESDRFDLPFTFTKNKFNPVRVELSIKDECGDGDKRSGFASITDVMLNGVKQNKLPKPIETRCTYMPFKFGDMKYGNLSFDMLDISSDFKEATFRISNYEFMQGKPLETDHFDFSLRLFEH